MLAVFERIDLSLLEEVLVAASGESSLQMVTFTNQPVGSGASVPDARITARFAFWFEVKTVRNTLRVDQLAEHLVSLKAKQADERLFVVTPDPVEPSEIVELADKRVVWFSFAALHDAIDLVLAEAGTPVSEQAQFLLRELQALFVEELLLDTDDVVVVAAERAYPEYLEHAAYVCQPGRSFRGGLSHMAFYRRGAIQPEVPSIDYREDGVLFTAAEAERRGDGRDHDPRIARLIEVLLEMSPRQDGGEYQVFLLSAPSDDATVLLPEPIANDKTTAGGQTAAWTQSHRYVSLARLSAPDTTRTSDLK